MLNWKRGREVEGLPREETPLEAQQRIGAELVEMSEQFVAVYTRESASVEHLQTWCGSREQGMAQLAIADWLGGKDEYVVVAQATGQGVDIVRTAACIESLLSDALAGVGTSEHGLRKSLCRVLSARQEVVTAVGRTWINLGGLSIAAELAKVK